MKNTDGGPAFPQQVYVLEEGVFVLAGSEPGLSKLEYFAAEAMKGHLAQWGRQDGMESVVFDIAEAMLAESEKRDEARETNDGKA